MINGPMRVKVTTHMRHLYSLKYQPVPIKDFINFKQMRSGNEILLNLDNQFHLADSELVSGLIELAKRDRNLEHNWNAHPITIRCLRSLKKRMPRMTS